MDILDWRYHGVIFCLLLFNIINLLTSTSLTATDLPQGTIANLKSQRHFPCHFFLGRYR